MDYNNLILSIDWMQLNCKGCFNQNKKYIYKELSISTGVFKKVVEVWINELKICTIAYEPFSPIIKPDTHIIKFDNKLLYFDNLFQFVDEFLRDHKFIVKSITRLDLAIDFNTFKNNLHPENLILNFLKNDYLRVNKGKYKLIGQQNTTQTFEYLRFGTGSSDVSVYLYNKSIEMQQKKFKQYIYNKWEQQKLNTTKDIWRLEISIKCNNLEFTDEETGEQHDYTYNNIKSESTLNELYKSLLYKYFRFKIKDNTVNKSRMEDVCLFDNIKPTYALSFVTSHEDFSRMDKIFIKMIEKFNNNLREGKKELSENIKNEIEIFVKNRRLEKWYELNIESNERHELIVTDLVNRSKLDYKKKKKIEAYQKKINE